MKIPTKHRGCQASQGQWLRGLRGGFVITLITVGLLLASLPGAAASSDGLPDPTPVLESSPSPSPEPTASPSLAPPEVTPSPVATGEPQPTPSDAGSPSPTWSPEPSPSALVLHDVGLVVTHVTAATLGLPGSSPAYLAPDAPLTNLPRFQVFRLRFEIQNTDATDVAWQPALDLVRPDGSLASLPAGTEASGRPFYAAAEWVREGAGSKIGPSSTAIPGGDGVTAGTRAMGINPLPEMTLAAGTTTVIEFSVRATVDAAYQQSYSFRLVDAAGSEVAPRDALVTMAAKPAVVLTPGQRPGTSVGADGSAQGGPAYRLAPAATTAGSIHDPTYSLATDACGACHRTHDAPGTALTAAPTQYALCTACHNGVDAPDVTAAYAGSPANDSADRDYYQHPVECAECHNPHNITSTASAAGPGGWSSSGLIAAAGGTAVVNGSPGSSPTYALLTVSTLEYQLCFKCHSGYAQLPSNAGQPPSHYELDAAIEFNPANGSYHPIEAPGTNDTAQMDASLAGTSPYKLWTFTSQNTIRCVNCHADASLAVLQLALGHLSVGYGNGRFGHNPGQALGHLFDAYHPVVDEIYLASAI